MVVPVGPVFPGRGKAPLEPQAFYMPLPVGQAADITKIFRGIWPTLPVAYFSYPRLPDYSWIYQTNPNLFVPPDTVHIRRDIWRSLPEAQLPWRLDATWTDSYNLTLIGQDKLPTGEQSYSLTVAPLTPPDQVQLHSWQWSYNLNLRGRDRLPVGDQTYDRPQLPLVPGYSFILPYNIGLNTVVVTANPFAQYDWPLTRAPWRLDQTWTQSYDPNLVGQDAMLVGEQSYTLAPSQVPPEQVQLHSWSWSYNLSLVGKDRLPTGEQTTDLAPAQKPYEQTQLHSWQWSYNLNLVGKDQLSVGEQFTELPPRDPREVRTWSWSYNLNLIAQDRLPTGEQIWDRPILPIPPAQTWIDVPKYNLIAKPFLQTDWPNPTPPYRIEQTWAYAYNQNLIAQDKLPTGEQTSELPPKDFLRLLQTWIQQTNLALLTAPPDIHAQARQLDWPLPRGAEPDWRRSWEWAYNKNLVAQDQLPFRQRDWPLTPAPSQAVQTWIDQTKILLAAVQNPFVQTDWPVPQAPRGAIQTWTNSYLLNLVGQDQLPNRQQDWPLTPAQGRSVDLATWINRVQFQLFKPFAQTDWPNPTPFARDPTLATIAESFNRNLAGQDRLPNRQQDWPLSAPAPQPLLQVMVQGKWFNLVPVQALPPGANFYDRPVLRPGTAANLDQASWRWAQITPPPVSAIIPLRTLMGTGV